MLSESTITDCTEHILYRTEFPKDVDGLFALGLGLVVVYRTEFPKDLPQFLLSQAARLNFPDLERDDLTDEQLHFYGRALYRIIYMLP